MPLRLLQDTLLMLVASVMRKLLWVLRYPAFAPESGLYRVGALQTRLEGAVACQVHYPAATTSSAGVSTTHVPYFRLRAVEGMADYSRTSVELLRILSNRQHPCAINAPPFHANKKIPVVVFSHGLGGSMEMYTQLCQQMASHGLVVIAMEHEDGSGAYAETPDGQTILYQRSDDTPYSRTKVLTFRRPFLQQRIKETLKVIEILSNPPETTSPQLQQILETADWEAGVALVGHSFGGASMALTVQEYSSSDTTKKLPPINSLGVLDPWAFSLDDQALQKGMDATIPTLSILSEAWLTNPETAQVNAFLKNCPSLTSLYAPDSVHASVADSVSWLPGFLGRKLYLRGRQEGRFQTIPVVAQACVQHIMQAAKSSGDSTPQHVWNGLNDYVFTHPPPPASSSRVAEESNEGPML